MDRTKEILKILESLSGSRSEYEVFCDWVKAMALAIQNSCYIFAKNEVWNQREKEYMQIAERYGEGMNKFVEMMNLLCEILEGNPHDALGDIYMKSGMGNKSTGQFFTPYHLSVLNARLSLPKEDDGEAIKINEPSCGGGGMIIAAAQVLNERGINYQARMDVVAQDLDWKGVYMTYVQLSLLGIRAVVVQGDTLKNPHPWADTDAGCIFKTPRKMGLLV